jgi:hypothetical protein
VTGHLPPHGDNIQKKEKQSCHEAMERDREVKGRVPAGGWVLAAGEKGRAVVRETAQGPAKVGGKDAAESPLKDQDLAKEGKNRGLSQFLCQ